MLILGLEWTTATTVGVVISLALFLAILLPFLVKEIRDGKREFGPLRRLRKDGIALGPITPTGTGDFNPGRPHDPAPGQPDGQPDPYSDRAQRNAPPVRS